MGTRADFYVGRGETAEWLGSIGYDGYPDQPGHPNVLLDIKGEATFRQRVKTIIDREKHGTKPEQGWPWPWNNSHTTDFAYCFDAGKCHVFCFGRPWSPDDSEDKDDGPKVPFPDMSSRKAVTMGQRSGLIVFGAPAEEE